MVFCTGCGAQLEDTAKFCTACGTQVPSAVAPATHASPLSASGTSAGISARTPSAATPVSGQPVAAPSGGGGAVKIILIVLLIIVGLGVISFAGIFWASYKLRKAVRVEQDGENATVTTPWGKVTSNQDASAVAKNLGIEIYPGAKPLPGASSVTFGNGLVGTAEFETTDPLDTVGKFYTSHYPKSTINAADQDSQTIMASTTKGMVTIVLERQGSGTKITLSHIGGNSSQPGGNQAQ